MDESIPAEDTAPEPAVSAHSGGGAHSYLKWLLFLALLYTAYFAKPLIMPIVLALVVSLLLSPIVATCKAIRIPRFLSAAVLIAVFTGPFVLLSIELAVPAQKWAARLPQLSAEITAELDALGKSIVATAPQVTPAPAPQKKKFSLFGWFQSDDEPEQKVEAEPKENMLVAEVKKGGIEVLLATLSAAPGVFAQLTIFLVLLFFILVFGPNLYSNLVEILPFIRDKGHATLLVTGVRQQLSRYMLTVTIINAALGAVTALILTALGLDDALLWGVLVALLNFAPYIGPIIGIVTLFIAGVAQYGLHGEAIVPAGVFFLLNIIEAQFVTPTALGKHMRMNPLILIVWILTWGWIWGPMGVLLAVPLLVCTKLAVIQLGIHQEWVRLIETRA